MARKKTLPSASARKQKIIHAAIKCFTRQGVAQTRLNEIAEKAEVDPPLVHYYFPTLDSLYADVIQEIIEGLKNHVLAAIESHLDDPRKLIEAYLRVYFDWAKNNPGHFSIVMYLHYLASYNPSFTQLNSLIRQTGRERITSLVYLGIEKNVFTLPEGMSAKETATVIQGILNGQILMAGTENEKNWDVFATQAVKASLRLLSVNS